MKKKEIKKWTPDEESILRKQYFAHNKNITSAGYVAHWSLPDRSLSSVINKMRHMEVTGKFIEPVKIPINTWTDEEVTILVEAFRFYNDIIKAAEHTAKETNRTEGAAKAKLYLMLKRKDSRVSFAIPKYNDAQKLKDSAEHDYKDTVERANKEAANSISYHRVVGEYDQSTEGEVEVDFSDYIKQQEKMDNAKSITITKGDLTITIKF